ncbi:hypothetical protein TCAL_02817 [Tigriopus californicus]|uniref:Mediator of RNA polymerase II transcription subunit 31 n=1 Tax=Tigriopus californicus TaxID=6832 RepID=A0A553NX30_TIGCA|nr:mediator of RNA polymerase II transcription subunit 31-A-like [Tigriopus californicus]TRY69994.1 hypothetical protein TCAL_02817 [Tigriopus californicus]
MESPGGYRKMLPTSGGGGAVGPSGVIGVGPPPPYPGYSPSHVSGGALPPASSPQFSMLKGTPPHSVMLSGPPSTSVTPSPAIYSEADEKQRIRFQIELEFVQCLGNPNYLHFLAQRGYFKQPKFIQYLKYLQYWKEPRYVQFIKYPLCLHFLELLQHEAFRKEIVNGQCAKFLDDQTILHWQHYTRKRARLIESKMEASNAANSATPNAGGPASSVNATTNNSHANATGHENLGSSGILK